MPFSTFNEKRTCYYEPLWENFLISLKNKLIKWWGDELVKWYEQFRIRKKKKKKNKDKRSEEIKELSLILLG